jgi:hypothetical protein
MSELAPEKATIIEALAPYPLHLLGWKAFQDLCVSVAEVCLGRPVQAFLPTNDAGRDGAFLGRWDTAESAGGQSTIQCKFTSRPSSNLTLSMLGDELGKAARLAAKGLAKDYIILTNHPVTGESEIAIKEAFEAVGVGCCRIFGADWISGQIKSSAKLRMLVPRLYGMGDLHDLLDGRAYEQAQLILSAMGDDLQRLVVTDPHIKSVRAISEHNLVLLLGAPAAGKSTIGASIAVGAADRWGCSTIRATSPSDIQKHLNPEGGQFFWIDDAWGNTQYQKQTAEAWNQVFPFMHSAMRKGTRFLITSRDYIWRAAQRDLKISALPVLAKSQVVIDVHKLSKAERAQILYNHMKLGDQPKSFRTAIKPLLPAIANRDDFLPETARRLGSTFFTSGLPPLAHALAKFFAEPRAFLQDTISGLSSECRAAIAVVFLNGGKVRSPVSQQDLAAGAVAFGVSEAAAREQLEALNGSLLLLTHDEDGAYWTYKHPTVSDAFSKYLATSPELVEVYLKGARANSIIYEVVCAGVNIQGAPLIVPAALNQLLADRIGALEGHFLKTFLSYRSNRAFSTLMFERRPDLLRGMGSFTAPIKEDPDATLLSAMYRQGILPEEYRLNFVTSVRNALVEFADASFLDAPYLDQVLSQDEMADYLELAKSDVLPRLPEYVDDLKSNWDREYPPDEVFTELEKSVTKLCEAITPFEYDDTPLTRLAIAVRRAVNDMEDEYTEPPSSSGGSTPPSHAASAESQSLFRDVDE